jgi:LEA14-like dessication related protein
MYKISSIICILIFWMNGCAPKFVQPELVSINRFQVQKLSFEGMELSFCTGIRNGNKYKIAIQGLEAEVFLDNRFIGILKTDSTLVLSKNGISEMPLSLDLKFKGIIQNALPLIQTIRSNSLVSLQLKGSLQARVKGMSREFPFNYTDKVKVGDLVR